MTSVRPATVWRFTSSTSASTVYVYGRSPGASTSPAFTASAPWSSTSPSPAAKKPLTSLGWLSSHHQVSWLNEKPFNAGSSELKPVELRFTDHFALAFDIAPPNR